jgi:hyperosmotically inducible periplasmic protein
VVSLPDYSVFDLITLSVEKTGLVNLGGYVVTDTLKTEAAHRAREVAGVAEVRNRIELAPFSAADEDIRRREYHAIYDESALSPYRTATSGLSMRPRARPWGAQARMFPDAFDGPLLFESPFHGYEPLGIYTIHILVKHGAVTLAGVIDNDADKERVGIAARGVTGVAWVVTRPLISQSSHGVREHLADPGW